MRVRNIVYMCEWKERERKRERIKEREGEIPVKIMSVPR